MKYQISHIKRATPNHRLGQRQGQVTKSSAGWEKPLESGTFENLGKASVSRGWKLSLMAKQCQAVCEKAFSRHATPLKKPAVWLEPAKQVIKTSCRMKKKKKKKYQKLENILVADVRFKESFNYARKALQQNQLCISFSCTCTHQYSVLKCWQSEFNLNNKFYPFSHAEDNMNRASVPILSSGLIN